MRRQKETSSKLRIVKRNNMMNANILVLHKNLVRNHRKCGRFIERCFEKNTYKLQNSDGVALQKKANGCNLKSYNDHDDNDASLASSPLPKKRRCDNESVEIVQQEEISAIDYLPVCGNWQKDRCEAFGLELHRANPKRYLHQY